MNRDKILNLNCFNYIVQVVRRTGNQETIRSGCWAIFNLMGGEPLPEFERVREGFILIVNMLESGQMEDERTLANCCSILNDYD